MRVSQVVRERGRRADRRPSASLSRRRLLARGLTLAAATTTWVVAPSGPRLLADLPPEVDGDAVRLTPGGQVDGWQGSQTLTPSQPVSMVAFLAPADAAVQMRADDGRGEWSAWQPVPAMPADEGPDGAAGVHARHRRTRLATTPAWLGAAERLQVRVRAAAIDDVEAHLIYAEDDGLAWSPTAGGVAHAQSGPPIITRAQWGANESWRRGTPSVGSDLRGAAVHHTVTGNTYRHDQAASVVRGIYRYHTQSLGWSDVGYNFLVDRFGRVYEGRAGGVDRHVIGAHAGGFNSQTFGVALIGTHGSAGPTPEALGAVAEVIAWKCAVHGLDPTATIELVSNGSSRYSRGTRVRLPAVVGHRDLSSTSCPGDAAYSQLTGARDRAATRRDAYLPGTPLPRLAGSDAVATAVAVSRAAFDDGGADRAVIANDRVFADAAVAGPLAGDRGPVLLTRPDELDARIEEELTRALPEGGTVFLLGGERALAPAVEAAVARRWRVERLAGATRVDTAAQVARLVIAEHGRREALIARAGPDDAWADALTAGAWGASAGVPLLLTDTHQLTPAAAETLAELGVERTIVCGGPSAVSDAVVDALPHPRRVAGGDRAETATRISADLWGPTSRVMFAGGYRAASWKDALVAAPLAARRQAAVLLVHHERMVPPTAQRVGELSLDSEQPGYVIGGRRALSESVNRRLGTLAGL